MIFKKEKAVISPATRIEEAQGKLRQAQNMFVKAQTEVDASDIQLDSVIEDSKAKIVELEALIANEQALIQQATQSKDKNAVFKLKISEFIQLEA